MTEQNTYHHGDLRRALLEEAGRILEAEGAASISLRRLARSLGVSHAAPGHHFSDRAELLSELAADGYAGLADALGEAMESTRPEDWLGATGKAYIRFGMANPERYRMMFGSQLMGEDCPERLRAESSRAYMMLLRASYRGPPDVDPADYHVDIIELFAWSLVHGAVMLWLDGQLGPGVDRETFLALTDRILDEKVGR
ncbi:MAG: WHG domain-containing protein [Acidimicrobiia bacterium]